MRTRRALTFACLCLLAFACPIEVSAARERIRLDQGWRFHLGDPPGVGHALDYEVRPTIEQSADGKAADARPETAQTVSEQRTVLRPWILPTANPLIADPGDRHQRPDGHPGSTLPFVQADFDDSDWPDLTTRAEALMRLGEWGDPDNQDKVTGIWRPLPDRDPEIAKRAIVDRIEELLSDPKVEPRVEGMK